VGLGHGGATDEGRIGPPVESPQRRGPARGAEVHGRFGPLRFLRTERSAHGVAEVEARRGVAVKGFGFGEVSPAGMP